MNKYEVLSLFGIMNIHHDMFFFNLHNPFFLDANEKTINLFLTKKDDILMCLKKLDIPFEILFDLFDEQYDTWHDDEFTYSIDYFIVEETNNGCRIGIFSKPDGSIAWLDEYGKWELREKSECGNSAIDFE